MYVLKNGKSVDCPVWEVSARINGHSHEVPEQTVLGLSLLRNGQKNPQEKPKIIN